MALNREREQQALGDFQTPFALALSSARRIDSLYGAPDRVIEPTAGLGTFLKAAYKTWGGGASYQGYEINRSYVEQAKRELPPAIKIDEHDFFTADWPHYLNAKDAKKVLVIGNPPWVTNAAQGAWGSRNLPVKNNALKLKGIEAKTGKANFDIAEWMLLRLFRALPKNGALAVLCKTMTARKVLGELWKHNTTAESASLFLIDAKKHFNVAVDACLFFIRKGDSVHYQAAVYSTMAAQQPCFHFGMVEGRLVSHLDDYKKYAHLEGTSSYSWRSGLKHDAAKVMELNCIDGRFYNGFKQAVRIEPDYLYPLLKSSDIGQGRLIPRKWVIVTQKKTGDATEVIKEQAPKTWEYLNQYSHLLAARKSAIYLNRPTFAIFGIGDYSFLPWKVAISGFYKTCLFNVIAPWEGRAVMLDDTCYFIACHSEAEANYLCDLLNAEPCQRFLKSLIFIDSKRPMTKEILQRISIEALAKCTNSLDR